MQHSLQKNAILFQWNDQINEFDISEINKKDARTRTRFLNHVWVFADLVSIFRLQTQYMEIHGQNHSCL